MELTQCPDLYNLGLQWENMGDGEELSGVGTLETGKVTGTT